MAYISDKRLFLTAENAVVEEGHPDAAFLLVPEGGQLSDEDAARHGLRGGRAPESPLDEARRLLADAERRGARSEAHARRQDVADLEADEANSEAEAKALKSATENKARQAPETKK